MTIVPRTASAADLGAKIGRWAAGICLITLGACGSSGPEVDPPQPGTALEVTGKTAEPLTLPPGQEVILLVPAVRNASGDELEITKLRAVPGDRVPESVQIVQVSIVRSPEIKPGTYVTFPPVARSGERCVRASVLSPSGVVVEPGDAPLVMVWLRAIDEGDATLDGVRMTYDRSGTRYEQEVEIDDLAEITVDPSTPARKPSPDEAACANEVRVLPGAVRS